MVNRVDRVDRVVVEAPLTIVVGGEVVATTMRTPGHDVELTAAGWSARQACEVEHRRDQGSGYPGAGRAKSLPKTTHQKTIRSD